MYKGYQEELFNCSWGVNAGFKNLADKLNELLPFDGKCENARTTSKKLDKFRRAQNCVYDLFNNGLCNRRGEFRRMFDGYSPAQTHMTDMAWHNTEQRVEEMLTPIILEAAKEQGIQ
tara:strand:- start:256 stop:606 length:351 start_codon:yes stop_codon:yes gene_type:complete